MEKSIKFASIDIGSNAMRLLFCRVIKDKKNRDTFSKEALFRMPLRLGEDAFSLGTIDPGLLSEKRTLEDDESFSFTTHGDELTGLRGPVEFKRAPSLSASGREALDSALKKPEERERGMTPLDRRTSITNRRGSTDARRSSIRRSSMRRVCARQVLVFTGRHGVF